MSSLWNQVKSQLKANNPPVGNTTTDATIVNATGATSLNPHEVRDLDRQGPTPKLTHTPQAIPEPVRNPPQVDHSDIKVRSRPVQISSTTLLESFANNDIARPDIGDVSTFTPCSRMMFYILHLMSLEMMDSYYLKRSVPNYFPLYVRKYFGTLFFIQILRCMRHANIITAAQRLFLFQFEEANPPESLPILAPLMCFFQSISCFDPESTVFRMVSPSFEPELGLDDGLTTNLAIDSSDVGILPQIPLLDALIHWTGTILAAPDAAHFYPDLTVANAFGYEPFIGTGALANPVQFVGRDFQADRTQWNAIDAYALSSPGLEYPLEADKDMIDAFRARFRRVNIVPVANRNGDDRQFTSAFLDLDDFERFDNLKKMVRALTDFWPGSGTLADCSVHGLRVAALIGNNSIAEGQFPKPEGFYRASANNWLPVKFTTTTHQTSQTENMLAFSSRINFRMENHPQWTHIGAHGPNSHRQGDFWDVRPILGESNVDNQHRKLPAVIRKMFINGNVADRSKSAE